MVASAHNCSMKSCSRQLEHGIYTSIVENGQAHRLGAVLMPSVDQVTSTLTLVLMLCRWLNKLFENSRGKMKCLQCVLVV